MSLAGIVSLVIPAVGFALAAGAAWLLGRRIARRAAGMRRETLLLILVMYLSAATEIIALRFGEPPVTRTVQLIPLRTTLDALMQGAWPFVYHVAGNTLWFAPLGMLLPALRPRMRSGRVLWAGALLSAVLECAQWLLATGMTDVDDVILNALGAALGFALRRICIGTKCALSASKN